MVSELGWLQGPITTARLLEMLEWRPRRMQLSAEWPDPLHPPSTPGKDWSLTLPFAETLRNAFQLMCPVSTIGMRVSKGRCWTYLNGTSIDEAPLESVRGWLQTVGRYVALRDCLALSFALDYDRQGGDPKKPQSEVGGLRGRAKPYQRNATPDAFAAARELAVRLLSFVEALPPYAEVNGIVAMPPSDPNKAFDLPSCLGNLMSRKLKIANLSPM
jgi:hypothetical protein